MTLTPLIESNWMAALLPEIILSLAGMLLILLDAFAPSLRRHGRPCLQQRLCFEPRIHHGFELRISGDGCALLGAGVACAQQ